MLVSVQKEESNQKRAVVWFVRRGTQVLQGIKKAGQTTMSPWKGTYPLIIEMATVTRRWRSTSTWMAMIWSRHRKGIEMKGRAYWDRDTQERITLMALRNLVRIQDRLCISNLMQLVCRCQGTWLVPWTNLITSCSLHPNKIHNNSKSSCFSNSSKISSKFCYKCNYSNVNNNSRINLLCSSSKWINRRRVSSSSTRISRM